MFRFISDLILNGVIGVDGVQLFGSVLSFLLNTDKQEHVNVPIIVPFCQTNLFACSGLVPLSCRKSASDEELQAVNDLVSLRLTQEQRSAISNLITGYFNSMVEHLKIVREKMNAILKSIKRQERTKGKCLL
jgi:regulator of nonsense transcripts 2